MHNLSFGDVRGEASALEPCFSFDVSCFEGGDVGVEGVYTLVYVGRLSKYSAQVQLPSVEEMYQSKVDNGTQSTRPGSLKGGAVVSGLHVQRH
jgi:hypothetical protein